MPQNLVVYILGAGIATLGLGEYLALIGRQGAVTLSACLAFGLSGFALMLMPRQARAARIASLVLSGTVLLIGALLLVDHYSILDVGPGGRPSLLGGITASLVGATQLSLRGIDSRPHLYLATAGAAIVLLTGILGLFVQVTDFSLVFAQSVQQTSTFGVSASVSVLLLSVASFAVLLSAPQARRFWNEQEDHWISAVAMLSVTAIVVAVGMAGAAIFMHHSVEVFSHTLQNSARANASIIEGLLLNARRKALEFSGVAGGSENGFPADALQHLATVPELGIRSVRRSEDPIEPLDSQRMRVALNEPEHSALLWDGEWLLETRVPATLAEGAIEDLIIEVRLDALARMVQGPTRYEATSSALVICATRDDKLLDCFPSALRDTPSVITAERPDNLLPIVLARGGSSGVIRSRDHFGDSVIAAYGPVGRTGLLLSEKIATAKLLAPVRDHFRWMALGVIGLLATGLILLPRLLQPLVNRLLEARARLSTVLDNIPDAVVTTDAAGRILSANPAAERAFGYAAVELIGSRVPRILAHCETGDAGTPRAVPTLDKIAPSALDIVGLRRDGRTFPAGVRVAEFSLQRQPVFVGVIRDNTEKQRAVQALAASRETLRALVENLPDVILRFDAQLCCMYVSPSLESSFGLRMAAVHGKTVAELHQTPGFPTAVLEPLPDILLHGQDATAEFSVGHGETAKYYHTRFVPEFSVTGHCERLLCVTRDVTAVRRAELVLRQVVTHSSNALEQERKQIAREVHDELGQVLTAIKTELSLMHLRSGAAEPEDGLRKLQDLANRAIHTVRDVVRALRPSTLDLGIVYALQWLSRDFEQRTLVACRLETPDADDLELDDVTATNLFRIVQECLTNIERHAEADEVRIALKLAGQELRLEVSDNGRGFDVERMKPRSFGLLGIEERATMIGGRAVIASEPGKGTHVVIHAPLSYQTTLSAVT